MIWDIWCHQNNIIFKNSKLDAKVVFSLVQLKAWARSPINVLE